MFEHAKSNFIVVFKNFKRYDCLELSIKTTKHFIPESDIFCVDMMGEQYSESFKDLIPLPKSQIFNRPTKYIASNPQFIESWRPYNCLFFSEGYNTIFDIFQNFNGKILAINEDQFFTNGNTLKELKENDFDLAWANWVWPDENTVNGSILCFNPIKCKNLFPLPEEPTYVDKRLYEHIMTKHEELDIKLYKMKNRVGDNYMQDGIRVTIDKGYSEKQQMIEYLSYNLPSVLNI